MLIIISALLLVVVTIVIGLRPMRMDVFADGVVIKDLYGVIIPNNTILSLRLVNELPKIKVKINACNGFRSMKGYCRVRTERSGWIGEHALLFLRNRKAPFIEMDTVSGLVFINQDNEDQTRALFDEMKQTVKLVDKNEIDYSAKNSFRRSAAKSLVFVLMVLLGFFGLAFWQISNGVETRLEVVSDGIETFGTYAEKISAGDIVSVRLIDTMPKIAVRRNGISFKGKMAGDFNLADKTKCTLFLENAHESPYIEMKTKADLFFFNKSNAEETDKLYDQMLNLINEKR
jgi:hypothetical protein